MNKTNINGIDVSEEIKYCNNCSNLGLDFEARKFYCSLSHRPDELPEVLSCDEFSTNCYIKRLQEENDELKEMLSKEPKAMQAFQIAYSSNKKENEILWGMVKDYKTALEEIREIAFGGADVDDCTFCYSIFEKCNEVLNEK